MFSLLHCGVFSHSWDQLHLLPLLRRPSAPSTAADSAGRVKIFQTENENREGLIAQADVPHQTHVNEVKDFPFHELRHNRGGRVEQFNTALRSKDEQITDGKYNCLGSIPALLCRNKEFLDVSQ